MDSKVFTAQVQRLAQAYGHTLNVGMIAFWFTEMNEQGLVAADLAGGVSRLIAAGERYFPSMAQYQKACTEAKYDRLRKEQVIKKQEERRHEGLAQEDILAKGLKSNPKTQALVKNALDLLTGKTTHKGWLEKQKGLTDDGKSHKMIREMEEDDG